jgi:hypothetical protein
MVAQPATITQIPINLFVGGEKRETFILFTVFAAGAGKPGTGVMRPHALYDTRRDSTTRDSTTGD